MNVIFVTVDSMRWDRVGRNGYHLPLTPEIDSMMSHAIACPSTYTPNSSTIGAFPSMMTSSRPLSYGGYDSGGFRPPPTLSATLAKAGYQVAHLSTVHWINSYFGYSEGVAYEEMLFSIAMLAKLPTALLRVPFTQFNSGQISIKDLAAAANNVLPSYFVNLKHYCALREQTIATLKKSKNSQYEAQTYRWGAVRKLIDICETKFNTEKSRFLQDAALHFAQTGKWILDRSWRSKRAYTELIETSARSCLGRLLLPINRKVANRLRHPYKHCLDADSLVDKVLATAQRLKSVGNPFLIWTHFFDAHIPFTCGTGRAWARDAEHWLRQIGHDSTIDPTMTMGPRPRNPRELAEWCALYDASIRFIDHHLGRLRRALGKLGLADTLIVITSDHLCRWDKLTSRC